MKAGWRWSSIVILNMVILCECKRLQIEELHGDVPPDAAVTGELAEGQIEVNTIDVFASFDPTDCKPLATTLMQEVMIMVDGEPFPTVIIDGIQRSSVSISDTYAGSIMVGFVNPGPCTIRLSGVFIEYNSLPWYKQTLYWVIISSAVVVSCVIIALLRQYSKNMKNKREYERQMDSLEAPPKDPYPNDTVGSEMIQNASPHQLQVAQAPPEPVMSKSHKRHTLPADINVRPFVPLPPERQQSMSISPPSRKRSSLPQEEVTSDVPKDNNNFQLMTQKLPPAVESPQSASDSPSRGRGRRRQSAPHGSAIPEGRRWSQSTFSSPLNGDQRRQLLEQAEKRRSRDNSVTT